MKSSCGGVSWALNQHCSLKIRENPENVHPGLWILLHHKTCHVLIFFSFWDLQKTDKYKNLQLKMKLTKDIWLPISWSNPYSYNFFIGGGSILPTRSRPQHFIGVWPEFAPLSDMATVSPAIPKNFGNFVIECPWHISILIKSPVTSLKLC